MKSLKLAFASVLLAASAASMAGPITPGAGWYGFCFGGNAGDPATAGCLNQAVGTEGNAFTFTLTAPGTLQVTDAFIFGDTFSVFVNSVLAFTTGGGTQTGPTTSDPDLAFSGTGYDHGFIVLGAGSYSVDIFTLATPNSSGGGAYVQVLDATSQVPEPGSLSLLALGLLGLAAASRGKRGRTARP